MNLTLRPIHTWPGARTPSHARRPNPFKATYSQTKTLLVRELEEISARNVVVQVGITENDLRIDGNLRANVKVTDPGVILAFDTNAHGPMSFPCDTFTARYYRDAPDWHINLRAIALGLEALRKLDRYGITSSGQQYTGWQQLGAAPMGVAAPMTLEEAAAFAAAGIPHTPIADVLSDPDTLQACYLAAAKQLHPDHGGDTAAFQRLQDAKRVLDQAGAR